MAATTTNKPKECLNKSQLARMYNVSRKTMSNWLKLLPASVGEPFAGHLYTPGQVAEIFNRFDTPDFNSEEK